MTHHVRMMHAELVSKDPAATQKFLDQAFGLKFDVMGPEMGNYRLHRGQKGSVPGEAAGDIGIRGPMGPEPTGTISYLAVHNIDEAIENAKAAGATIIMEKTEIPKVGFTAVYVAPGEVTLGLFQYLTP
jgi:predicted enzyme related to lactoylglutathione lyase